MTSPTDTASTRSRTPVTISAHFNTRLTSRLDSREHASLCSCGGEVASDPHALDINRPDDLVRRLEGATVDRRQPLAFVFDHELPCDGLAVNLAGDGIVSPLALAGPAQLAVLLRKCARVFALIPADVRGDVPGAADGR